jgi:prepilin-type N-terminal cleavage/methylation domain-containing protein
MQLRNTSFTQSNHLRGFTLLEILTVVGIIGFLAAIAIPSYVHARTNSQKSLCLNNLRQIDDCKQQWALENNKVNGDQPQNSDLAPFMKCRHFPTCPNSGVYTIGNIGTDPTCNVSTHVN